MIIMMVFMMIIMDDHNIMEGSVGPWQALGNRSDNPSGPSPFGLPGGSFLIFANHSKLILTLDHNYHSNADLSNCFFLTFLRSLGP